MTPDTGFDDRRGRYGDVLARYRDALRDTLDDERVVDARATWLAFVREHHGEVFARLADDSDASVLSGSDAPIPDDAVAASDADADAVASAVFVRTLSFDAFVSAALDAAEREFSVDVVTAGRDDGDDHTSRDDRDSADILAAFDDVHAAVAAELDAETRATLADLAAEFVRTADPAAVAALHARSVSLPTRCVFGRYDTPAGLAELAVETVRGDSNDTETAADANDADDFETAVVLDPGCGAGAFLAAAARAKAESLTRDGARSDAGDSTDGDSTDGDGDGTGGVPPAAAVERVADTVRGFDVNPLAVRASRLALVLALRPLLRRGGVSAFAPRVVLADAVETTAADAPLCGTRADVLLGNPPWLTWDSLTPRVKDRWRSGPICGPDLDLFPHRGRDARLGYANDDLSLPYAWACVHEYLRDGGRAAFVLKRDLMTGPAGELLRRRRVGDRPLSMRRVHDFGSLSPFGRDVSAGTALYHLGVGESDDPARSPADDGGEDDRSEDDSGEDNGGEVRIPVTTWSRDGETPAFDSLAAMRRTLATESAALVHADPTAEASPWVRSDAERRALGDSAYRIRHGVKDDAKEVYALDAETIEAHGIEPDHVYPYLKSRHIVKYGLFGHDRQLVPQRLAAEDNEAALRRETPNTYAYLDANRERLTRRGSSWFDEGPFYSLFGLGPYTWADYKVVWCRLGFKPHFAVVSTVEDPLLGEKPVVPGDHCMFVGTDDEREAHYLCGLLNSAPYQRCLRDVSSGGKSSLSKSTVARLSLPEWAATDAQEALATASMAAHDVVPEHVDCSKRAYNAKTIPELDAVQARIDRAAERLLPDRDATANE